MISNVNFNSTNIRAGRNIVMTVEAMYPIVVEVYCFVTQPPPPNFVPCPDSGRHEISESRPFEFRTSERTFENDGYVEFQIMDADGDSGTFRVEIEGLRSGMVIN